MHVKRDGLPNFNRQIVQDTASADRPLKTAARPAALQLLPALRKVAAGVAAAATRSAIVNPAPPASAHTTATP